MLVLHLPRIGFGPTRGERANGLLGCAGRTCEEPELFPPQRPLTAVSSCLRDGETTPEGGSR